MNRVVGGGVVLLVGAFFLAPSISFAQTAPSSTSSLEWSYKRSTLSADLGSEVSGTQTYEDDEIVNSFLYRNGRLYEDNKWTKPKATLDFQIWDMFIGIAGPEYAKKFIRYYVTFRDGESSTLGAVIPFDRGALWMLAVNANNASLKNPKWRKDMSITLIHEFAHIVTLNKVQFKHTKPTKSCQPVYKGGLDGCPLKNSYYKKYLERFWNEGDFRHLEAVRTEKHDETRKRLLLAYYREHVDDYTTKYAARNPEEDIAESFTDFILRAKPTGTKEKDQKLLFFYEYPELVTMRERIRAFVGKDFQ